MGAGTGPYTAGELAMRYAKLSDEELAELAAASYELTEALMSAHPNMAQDAGFELFDRAWARRYWRAVLREARSNGDGGQLRMWAVGTTVAGLAELLVSTFGVPATAVSSAVALAIILTRAAKAVPEEPDGPEGRQAPDDGTPGAPGA